MATEGKGSISYRKQDNKTDRSLAIGSSVVFWAHKFTSAGQTDIDLTALNAPSEMTALGFVNPSSADLANAQLIATKGKNLLIFSSANGSLMNWLSFDVVSQTKIRLKNGAQSQVNEIIQGVLWPVSSPLTGIDATAIVQTGTLGIGSTDVVVNTPFTYNKYSSQPVGDITVYLDGQQVFRNVGNVSTGEGNYYEVAPSSGNLSNTIRFNVAPVGTAKNYAIVSTGLVARAPTASYQAAVDTLATSLDLVISDLALTTGNPTTNYRAQPNSVDLSMFGNKVNSFINEVHYDAVVGSSTQLNAGKCTHTSVQAAIDVASSGAKILILQGTYTENVSVTKKINLFGKGNSSVIAGTLTLASGSSLSRVSELRFTDNITINGTVTGCFVVENWLATGKTIIDSGSGNIWSGRNVVE
jgi:hypothetical protein